MEKHYDIIQVQTDEDKKYQRFTDLVGLFENQTNLSSVERLLIYGRNSLNLHLIL